MEYMNIKEVAECLRIHPNTVYRWCRSGDLPAIRLGTTIRIKREDLESFLSTK